MNLFDVYPLQNIEPVQGKGSYVLTEDNTKYLDFYGGHAVVSIGHSHPHYIDKIQDQLGKIGFYSNSVQNRLQPELAQKLGELSGYPDYQLFLCNSGAEANENAFKLASFHTGRRKILALKKAFHGRTSLAVAATDNPKIVSQANETDAISFIEINDITALRDQLKSKEYCAVVIEGIQGVAGINCPSNEFLEEAWKECQATGTLLILDEIQSGYGRTGKFFAHQYTNIKPDIITVAKGMGNGFPIGGVIINPALKPWYGMLGTTFGGNHLACAAGIAVLDVLKKENLTKNAYTMGHSLMAQLKELPQVKGLKGKGLMIGIEFDFPIKSLRQDLLVNGKVFTGNAADPNILRILPPLNIGNKEITIFIDQLKTTLKKLNEDETVHIS